MSWRIVDISAPGRYLCTHRGFLVVKEKSAEVGRIPLDDLSAVLVHAHGITYSNELLVRLAARNIILVLCDTRFVPVAWLWPLEGNHRQGRRMECQLQAKRPLKKRLWQSLVRAKIRAQAGCLQALAKPDPKLNALVRAVRSGDPDNLEAQAARRYWPRLFGEDFRRDRDLAGANRLLNYGYTVLRAAAARALTSAGLHPSVSVHHRGPTNTFALVDNVMEPFRPMVDWVVHALVQQKKTQLTPETKRALAAVLQCELHSAQGISAVSQCLGRLATSLALSFEQKTPALAFPDVNFVQLSPAERPA